MQTQLYEVVEGQIDARELAQLEADERESLMREKPDNPAFIIDLILKARMITLKRARMNALDEETFRAHRSLRDLRDTVIQRHGADLLESSSGSAKGTGATNATS